MKNSKRNNIKKSITISATLAAILGIGIITKPADKLSKYIDIQAQNGNLKVDGPMETKGIYKNWIKYIANYEIYNAGDSTWEQINVPLYMNYILDVQDGQKKYYVGLILPDADVNSGSTTSVKNLNFSDVINHYNSVESKTAIDFYDLDKMPEDGWTQSGADAFDDLEDETERKNSPYSPIQVKMEGVSSNSADFYETPESEWPFSVTAPDFFSANENLANVDGVISEITGTPNYNAWQHALIEIPLDDVENPYGSLYTWQNNVKHWNTNSMDIDSRFAVSGMTINDGNGGIINPQISAATGGITNLNERDESIWLRYPEPTFNVVNDEDEDGTVDGGSFLDGYNVDVKYDHSPTNELYSIVHSIEYTLYGPELKDDGTTDTLWDRWTVTDAGIEREYRISPDSPATTTETILVNEETDEPVSPWLDGHNDIGETTGSWDGEDYEFNEKDGEGDVNIAMLDPITFTPTDPNNDSATNYTTAWLFSNTEYKVKIEIDGKSTGLGQTGYSFIWPDSLGYEGTLTTEEYVPSAPVVNSMESRSESTVHADDGHINETFDFNIDTKSDSEFDGSLESPSYISKIEIVDVNDSNKVYGSKNYSLSDFDDEGKLTGFITTNDLPANSELNLALRITYGKGEGNYVSEDSHKIYNDSAILINTSSRGFADKEITSLAQSGETIIGTQEDPYSKATVNVVVDDIFQIEDGYTADTIPTTSTGSNEVLASYDSSAIKNITVVDSSTGEEYGSVNNPAESNGTIAVDLDGLKPNADTDVKALLTYTDDYGSKVQIESEDLKISADPIGAFTPEVQEFVLEQPVLNPSTRKYTIGGHAAIDIAPTTDADGNGYTGEGIYAPSNVQSVEIWETSKTDAAVLTIDDDRIDNTATIWNSEDFQFTIGENDEWEIPANSDLNFKLVINYDDGQKVESLTTQNVTTGTRGEIGITGSTFDVDASRVATNQVGPEMNLLWTLDYDSFGFDPLDFNPLSIDIEIYDTFNNKGGEHFDEQLVATQHYDGVVDGTVMFGGNDIDLNQDTTHDFTLKAIVTTIDGETNEYKAPQTLHYDAGQLVAGAYVPTVIEDSFNVKENEIEVLDDPFTSRDSIDISFDEMIAVTDDGVEPGYLKSGVNSIKLYAYTNNESDYTNIVEGEENGMTYGEELHTFYDGSTPELVNRENHFEYSFTDMFPNRDYTFSIVTNYTAYKMDDEGKNIVVDTERTVDSVKVFNVHSQSVGYEDIDEEDDLSHINIARTATTATIQYEIANFDYNDGVNKQYFENYKPTTVKVVDYDEQNHKATEIASAEASTNSIKVTNIPVGYNIAQGNLRFQIYTEQPTYSNEGVEHEESVDTNGAEFLAISEVIDAEWLQSFDNTPPEGEDSIDDIINGTYEAPTFGEMKIDQSSITKDSFKFSIDIIDNSNLIDFSQSFAMSNDGKQFEAKLITANRGADHVTSGTGTYEFEVSGLKSGTTYGTDWKFTYSIYDLEADINSNQTIDVTSNISIETLSTVTAGSAFLWIIIILLIILIIASLGIIGFFWYLYGKEGVLDHLMGGDARIEGTISTTNGTVTFDLDKNESSEFVELIKGRKLFGIQGDQEIAIDYSAIYDDAGEVEITLKGITNGQKIRKLVFVANEDENAKLQADYDKSVATYEADLAKYEEALTKWNEAAAKAKEEEKEFTKEKPVKPSKPAKVKLVKNIKLVGSVDTELLEEYNESNLPKTIAGAQKLIQSCKRELKAQKGRSKHAERTIAKSEDSGKTQKVTQVKNDADKKVIEAQDHLAKAIELLKELKAQEKAATAAAKPVKEKAEKPAKEKAAKESTSKGQPNIWTRDELEKKSKPQLVEIAVGVGIKKDVAEAKTKPELVDAIEGKKKITAKVTIVK